MPQLNVALVPAPDQVVVRLTGEVDLSSVSLVTDALVQAAGLGTRQVVVDVAAARFWDCSGLHALTDFTGDLGAADRACRIVGAPAVTRRLIEAAGLTAELELDGPLHDRPSTPPSPTANRPVAARPAPRAIPVRRAGARDDRQVRAGAVAGST